MEVISIERSTYEVIVTNSPQFAYSCIIAARITLILGRIAFCSA